MADACRAQKCGKAPFQFNAIRAVKSASSRLLMCSLQPENCFRSWLTCNGVFSISQRPSLRSP
jgi:hypothetical protein